MSFRVVVDQMKRSVRVPALPQRIVSLVPSQTELLFDLGLADRIVGVTKFCIHPQEAIKTKANIGGTKKFRFDVIDQLNPDLIIGNKEENYEEGIARLTSKYPVWMSDIVTFADALDMIRFMGEITQTSARANELADVIEQSWSTIHLQPVRVLYLIWREPWMAVGRETFIHSVLEKIGWANVVEKARYPKLTEDELQQLQPELVLLSSEPYPFKEQHLLEVQTIFPNSRIQLVDGEIFSWYGSRLVKAADYFNAFQV